ncbi:acetolactate synthase small subunit [Oceanispirochaeta crateris]|jgi:acetolactate synthase-1/3 small subunit|uniref:Acetolactate synthase small subunit n=1 Tax=Oceanispirochaeta crateris TaxID=2518645 RepID=A0A5C1QJH7_9SPIO|nr:acetolactate synthase small subunit [Oceanispirochaeta crateris]QEN07150.1 acetolactate synthase small subunit [Oceanispirochaeta crateris]
MNETQKRHNISLYVENKPGVTIRIALVFARRGYNIESFVGSPAQDDRYSRINIEATGDSQTLHLMLEQLNRLVDVIHAREYSDEDVIQKELALIKVRCNNESRTEILQITGAFKCRNVDISDTTMTFQVTGKSSKIDAVSKMLDKFGVLEVVRTGKLLIARGKEETSW